MKIKRFLKRMSKGLFVLGAMGLMYTTAKPKTVSAHNGYYLSVTIDPTSRKYVGMVSMDKNKVGASRHAEVEKTGTNFNTNSHGPTYNSNNGSVSASNVTLPVPKSGKWTEEWLTDSYKSYMLGEPSGDSEHVLLFTFPGRHIGPAGAADRASRRQADGKDREQANWVNQELLGGLNEAINFVYTKAYANNDDPRTRLIEVGTKLANAGKGAVGKSSSSFTVNGEKFTVSSGSDVPAPASGVDKSDYVKVIHNDSSQHIYAPYRVQKGYGKNQNMWPIIKTTDFSSDKLAGQDAKHLNWSQVVMQGNHNFGAKGIEFSGVEELNPPNKLEKMIAGFFDGLLGFFESALGLNTLPELMLNRGSYGMNNFRGVMPVRMAEVADYVHFFMQAIAWLLLIAAFAKLLAMRNLSAINPRMRVDLKEGIMDLVGAGFALVMFIPIFRSLLLLNEGLVEFLGGISKTADLFGGAQMTNGGYLGPVIIRFMFVAVNAYMNIHYILRGITVAALYVFAPIFIVSIAFGGKYKQLFSTFAKELAGMIFLQSIHAGLLSLYSLAFNAGAAPSILYSFVLATSFIPMTKFFKQTLLGIKGDSMGDAIAGSAVSAGAGLAVAGAAAGVGNLKSAMGGGGSSGGGGSNFASRQAGGGGGTSINNVLDNDFSKNAGIPSTHTGPVLDSDNPGASGLANKSVGGMPQRAMSKAKHKANELKGGMSQGTAGMAKGIGKSALKGAGYVAKQGTKAGLMASAIMAEGSLGSNSITSAASRAMLYGNSKSKNGGGFGSASGGSNVPSRADLSSYETQSDKRGFIAQATDRDTGDIYRTFDKQQFLDQSGYESLSDNGQSIIATTSQAPSEGSTDQQLYEAFQPGGDENRREAYERMGVERVGKTAEGKLSIAFNKERKGIQSLGQNDEIIQTISRPYAASMLEKSSPLPETLPQSDLKAGTGG